MTKLTYEELREIMAQLSYEWEPYYEPGEFVDGFQVSPGGDLSWEQAKARDAEFAPEYMVSITKPHYDYVDKLLSELRARGVNVPQ